MSRSNFNSFLDKVISRVKSKEAHGMIIKELTHHLEELSQTFQKDEINREEAEKKAVEAMGNPFTIGDDLNKIHKPRMDWVIITIFFMLVGASFLALIGGVWESNAYFHLVNRQALLIVFAMLILLSFLFFDYRKLQKLWIYFYGSAFLFLLYTVFNGTLSNGRIIGIALGEFSISASLTLLLFFLAWAGLLMSVNKFSSWWKQLFLVGLYWLPVFIYMMLPSLELTIIYLFSIGFMIMYSSVKKALAFRFALVHLAMGMVFVWILLNSPYRLSRLTGFLNPEADSYYGYIYNIINSVLSEAGWFGHGLSNQLGQTLPAAHTDFVFPYLVHSLGWVFGIGLCCILFVIFLAPRNERLSDEGSLWTIVNYWGSCYSRCPDVLEHSDGIWLCTNHRNVTAFY